MPSRRGGGGRSRYSSGALSTKSRTGIPVTWMVAALSGLIVLWCLINTSTCHFLQYNIDPLEDNNDDDTTHHHSIGLYCPAAKRKDVLWIWSAVFFTGTLLAALISLTLALAQLGLSTSSLTRRRLWRAQSITAAGGAVTSVPTFLLYQSAPCQSPNVQCQWDYGSSLMIATGAAGMLMVLLTLCYPPDHVVVSWKRRSGGDKVDLLPVNRTMQTEAGDEEAAMMSIVRIVGPVGHSEGVEVPVEPHSHLSETSHPKQPPRRFLLALPTRHVPLPEEEKEKEFAADRGPRPVDEEEALDPVFSSADAQWDPVVVSKSTTTEEATAPDPTKDWKVPRIPNISLIDTEEEEEDDEEEEDPYEPPSLLLTDDLGSLEPSEVDGEESILDRTMDFVDPSALSTAAKLPPLSVSTNVQDGGSTGFQAPPSLSSTTSKPSVPNVSTLVGSKLLYQAPSAPSTAKLPSVANASLVEASNSRFQRKIFKKRQRAPRLIKGYRLLDDSDIDMPASAHYYYHPTSPPLEILTLNIATEQDADLHLAEAALDIHTSFSNEPEPYLEFSDDEDDESDFHDRNVPMGSNDRPAAVRHCRRQKQRSQDESVASSISRNRSLLSVTIAEETAVDLEEDQSSANPIPWNTGIPMVRSQSVPNLARYYAISRGSQREIYDDIHMTGIHQFHTAQIFRLSSNHSDHEGSHGQRRRRRQLEQDRVPILARPHQKRRNMPSLFRTERALRAGIHDASLDDGGDDDNDLNDLLSQEDLSVPSESLRFRNARIARLKRLQKPTQRNVVDSPYRALHSDPAEDAAYSITSSGKRSIQEAVHGTAPTKTARTLREDLDCSRRTISISSSSSSSGNPKKEEEGSNAVLRSSAAANYEGSNDESYLIDLLDVQLAELNRPEGSMVGPDEASL